MDPQVKRKRVLQEQLGKDYDLLEAFENNLRYEDDPKRKAKLRDDIEDLRKQIELHKRELNTLSDDLDALLKKIVKLYLAASFEHDLFAELDQAGEIDPDRSTLLQKVFIDLDVKIREGKQPHGLKLDASPRLKEQDTDIEERIYREDRRLSAMECLLKENWLKVMIIGGPGQGKSTLGQHLAQVHRAKLLAKSWEFEPAVARIPFRVVLKYFAQWLADDPERDNLEAYLAEQVAKSAAREVSTKDIHEILRCRPCLLILDGLDEVTTSEIRVRMLNRIREFLSRTEQLDANLMVMSTSRQTEYENQFDPEHFWHLELLSLPPEKVRTFANKWVTAKKLPEEERNRVIQTLKECQEDKGLSALLETPLQVTIILLIIKDGGRPPSQREALFSEYWNTIFRREKGKTKGIIQSDQPLLFSLHAYLGYLLHRRAAEQNVQSLLPQKEFKRSVRAFLRQEDSRSPDRTIDQKTKQLVWEARDRLVLFVEPEPGLYGFELRSIQEYFAAVHLVQTATNTEQRFERLKAIATTEHWRNVALFFAGRVARNYRGEASSILELVCRPVDREGENRFLRPGAWFALAIAADGALGTNRDLQYNAIEYGLTVLETGLTDEQQRRLHSIATQISSEDRRDILRPILEDKLRLLPQSCLESALHLLGRNFGPTPLFEEQIQQLLQGRRDDVIVSALDLAMRYEPEPEWMVRQLHNHWPHWKERLMDWWLRSPQYVETILRNWSPSTEKITELAETVLTSHWSYLRHHIGSSHLDDETNWSKLELNTQVDQIVATLKCISVIASWDRIPGTELRLARDDISLSTPQEPRAGRSLFVPDALFESLNDLLRNSDVMPWLRLPMWILFLAVNKPTVENSTAFLTDIWNIQYEHQLPVRSARYFLSWIWPLSALAVDRQQKLGPEANSKLLPFLDASTQVSIANEVTTTVQAYIDPADRDSQVHLFNAIRTGVGLDELLPELSSLAERMGVTLMELLDCHIRAYRYHDAATHSYRYSVEELQDFLKSVEDGLDAKKRLARLSWFLSEVDWPIDSELQDQVHRLLQRILEKASETNDWVYVDLSITFYLKLLTQDPNMRQFMPQFFSALSKLQHSDSRLWNLGSVFAEIPTERISWLKEFLTHDNEPVRRGAAIFWKLVIDSVTRYRGLRLNGSQKDLQFVPEVGLNFLGEENKLYRLTGIDLLTFSDYPIEDAKYRDKLTNILQESKSPEEERAWANFLERIAISDTRIAQWCGVLERILREPQNHSNMLLSNAMERYHKLNPSPDNAITSDGEKKLGLP